ncbi:unnamed protein product [Eruca vesicaria subsp. sativa]|uniref:Uncharacterized protein n=1 Tax=Eruca vesicaria subsp. sativa TaxID=29727 RepID=A0ABC8M8Z6_ERUVS|nr:unnamed protein product [Eruca vesicaria subsp. sativa]
MVSQEEKDPSLQQRKSSSKQPVSAPRKAPGLNSQYEGKSGRSFYVDFEERLETIRRCWSSKWSSTEATNVGRDDFGGVLGQSWCASLTVFTGNSSGTTITDRLTPHIVQRHKANIAPNAPHTALKNKTPSISHTHSFLSTPSSSSVELSASIASYG